MKQKLNVTTVLDHPAILESLVEKLAVQHNQSGNQRVKLPRGWEAFETSSTESYVSGSVTFDNEGIQMPFITSCLFTCQRVNGDSYSLTWSSSLS